MSKSIRLYIRKSDIKEGIPGMGTSCPIARSLKRKIKKHVMVDESGAYVNSAYGTPRWKLSKKGISFIRNFDSRKSVKPGKITLLGVKRGTKV